MRTWCTVVAPHLALVAADVEAAVERHDAHRLLLPAARHDRVAAHAAPRRELTARDKRAHLKGAASS